MARKLGPGEQTPIEVYPYRINEKRRKERVPNGRQATLWRARAYYMAEDGTLHEVTRWAKRQRDASEAVGTALDERRMLDGAPDDQTLTPSSPFIQAGAAWLAWIERPEALAAKGGLSERTKYEYRSHYERHIDAPGSPLRGRSIAQVNDPQRLILFLQDLADSSGTQTAKMSRTVLAGILGLCLRRGVIRVNVARSIGSVSARRKKPTVRNRSRAFTRKERDKVIAHADNLVRQATNPRTRRKWEATADLLAFMAGTGCRISEARLLMWSDVDLKRSRVRIRGSKTLSSDRINNLPKWLKKRLARRANAMEQWEHGHPFVFSLGYPREVVLPNGLRQFSADNVPPGDSNLGKWVRDVLDGAGFPWAIPHTFRRTVATLLHEAGIPLVAIADQLGHADPSMTMSVYLGRDLEGDKSALAKVL